VDVNILGHIFEHSLSEIEEVQAELEGKAVEKTKTKRKKDGVFYTPRYITKYIVENTVGELCRQKKEELKITDDEFAYRKRSDARENKLKKLNTYRKWLLELTICDPACGSGAFLNQALEYLIAEHRYIDELRARLLGEKMVMNDMETEILSHNLFGVDINEEAVEIARLSLWLRTAQKGRKLSDLSKSIKCGNSLIDDPAVAGDKAYNWQNEFPEIFGRGGFDVVIGNPPYGAKFSENEKKFVKERFTYSTEGKIDSYRIFYQKGIEIIRFNGLISFITPNTFLYNVQSKPLRKEILTNLTILDAVELRKNIFEDAPDVVTVILVLEKSPQEQYQFRARVAFHNVHYIDLNTSIWYIDQFINVQNLKRDPANKINLRAISSFILIKQKLEGFSKLGQYFHLRQGTKPYGVKQDREVELLAKVKYDESWEKAINGKNISRYYINYEDDYVQRSEDLHSALPKEITCNEKIYFQRMRKISLFPRIISCYDNDSIHGLYTCSVIFKKDEEVSLKYTLCVINSRLINIWYKNFDTDIEIKLDSVKQIPFIKGTFESQAPIIEKADIMLSKNKELREAKKQFQQLLTSKYEGLNISKKFEDWPSLSFTDFLKELTKQKIKLPLAEQTEWMQHFENEKAKANAIQQVIDSTDKEIDQMVYELYGLTEEEIKIVENIN
jgi:type I restriction-modification system DNA methylase subunit